MYRQFNMFLSIILLMGLLLAPAGNAAAQATGKGILAAPAPNLILDPNLSGAYHNPTIWKQASTNADWTVCTTSNTIDCLVTGVAGPRSNTKWGFFGILDWEDPETESPEESYLYQDVTFPGCGASLQFYFWIGQAPLGSGADDKFEVWIDDFKIFGKSALDAASYPTYTLVTLDVSDFADGAVHKVEFYSITTDQAVIFNLDDISLTRTCVTISGNVGIAGATLDYTGGLTTADGSGNYSFDVAYNWAGTVTPSKLGYTFEPASRTYPELTTDQTGQNYVATSPTISGNVGVAGVTLSYTDGAPKTATSASNGDYSFPVSGDWSGTVTPSHPCYTFTPTDTTYTNVIADQTGQDYTPTPAPAAGCSEIKVDIAGANEGIFPISSQGTLTQKTFPAINTGPVKIYSTAPILGADRVIYKVGTAPVSFTESIGLPDSQVDKVYWLPWYNSKTLTTQLQIANVSGADANDVQVFIGSVPMGSFQLPAGTSIKKTYANVDRGPVKIVSDQNIVAAEIVVYKVNNKPTSFSKMMALPANQLDTVYWLPWYNSKYMDTQLRIANASESLASVDVYIGSKKMIGSPFEIPVGTARRLTFKGLDKGPVKIVSTENIVVSERVFYTTANGISTSFSEMIAFPNKAAESIYWLPRYNNVDLGSQLRITNVDASPATVHVVIGGQEVTGSPFTVLAGQTLRKILPGINNGLVKIESENNVKIVMSERVIYKVKGVDVSFSEIMGLPAGQLDTIYWLPWYNSRDLDTFLRFGLP